MSYVRQGSIVWYSSRPMPTYSLIATPTLHIVMRHVGVHMLHTAMHPRPPLEGNTVSKKSSYSKRINVNNLWCVKMQIMQSRQQL
jgi:hypothetical protein